MREQCKATETTPLQRCLCQYPTALVAAPRRAIVQCVIDGGPHHVSSPPTGRRSASSPRLPRRSTRSSPHFWRPASLGWRRTAACAAASPPAAATSRSRPPAPPARAPRRCPAPRIVSFFLCLRGCCRFCEGHACVSALEQLGPKAALHSSNFANKNKINDPQKARTLLVNIYHKQRTSFNARCRKSFDSVRRLLINNLQTLARCFDGASMRLTTAFFVSCSCGGVAG